jgi:hypothetical protein
MWNEATGSEAPEFNKGALPEGQYGFKIDKVELKQASNGNRYINIWLKEIKGGNLVFYSIYATADYENHTNQQWVLSQFNALKRLFMVSGVAPPTNKPTPSDLQTLKDAFIDAKVGIEKNHKDEDQNKVVDTYPFSGVKPEPAPMLNDEMDDSIPF